MPDDLRMVRVEQRHLDLGVRNDPQLCPVALALQDALGCEEVYSLCTAALCRRGDRWVWLRMPFIVQFFVAAYEQGDSPRPFGFQVDLGPEGCVEFDINLARKIAQAREKRETERATDAADAGDRAADALPPVQRIRLHEDRAAVPAMPEDGRHSGARAAVFAVPGSWRDRTH